MTDEKRKEIVESICGNCWEYWDFSTGVRTQKLYPIASIKYACPADGDGNNLHVELHNGYIFNVVIDRPVGEFVQLLLKAKEEMHNISMKMGNLPEIHRACALYLQHGDKLVEKYL